MMNDNRTKFRRIERYVLAGILCMLLLFGINFYAMKKNALIDLRKINRQTLNHMEDIMQVFDHFAQEMQEDVYLKKMLDGYDESGSPDIKNAIRGYLNKQRVSFSYPASVSLLLSDDRAYTNVGCTLDLLEIKKTAWFQEYLKEEHTRFYSPLMDRSGDTESENKDCFLAVFPYGKGTYTGTLFFEYSFSVFSETIREYERDNTQICILGRDNEILYKTGDSDHNWKQVITDFAEIKAFYGEYQAVMDYAYGSDVIGCTKKGGWKLITRLSNGRIVVRMMPGFLISALFFWIVYLGLIFLIIREKRQRQMEYALLATQINPHFIYKTLNTIAYLSKKEENQEVIAATRALEEILKDKLRIDQISIYDTVERELSVVQQYLTIQQIYYRFTIRLETQIPETLMQEQIPKNIILPLVENALYHGILQKENEDGECVGGTIGIKIEKTGKKIRIFIRDDGCGMNQQELQRYFGHVMPGRDSERGKHIGITNIKRRLFQVPGVSYKMHAESESGKGTVVILELKMKQKNFDAEYEYRGGEMK